MTAKKTPAAAPQFVAAKRGDLVLLCVEHPAATYFPGPDYRQKGSVYYTVAVVSSVDRGGVVISATGKDGQLFSRNGRRGKTWRKCIVASAKRLTKKPADIVTESPEWDGPDEAVAALLAYKKEGATS